LEEFSPIGLLFTKGCSLKITKVRKILGLLFARYKLCIDFDKTLVVLHPSQTHLVTLLSIPCNRKCFISIDLVHLKQITLIASALPTL
jgi:hypothetical protein